MRRSFFTMIVIIIITTISFGCAATQQPVKQPESAPVAPAQTGETGVTPGRIIPKFTLASLDNQMITVGLPGKITVINFWATWCPPCRAEMPELNEFAAAYRGQIVFYAINIQESTEKVNDFLRQNNFTMPVLLDKNGDIARNFHINAIPTTIVTDKNGIIKYRKPGGVTMAELEGIVKGLL